MQNNNYYLQQGQNLDDNKEQKNDKQGISAKTRRLKFFIDNVLPRAADVVAVDAYANQREWIQMVMFSVKMDLARKWSTGID